MMTTRKKNQLGFTLVEIMIVVAIVGVLVAVAIPQYATFSISAKRAEGISLIQGIHLAETSYYTEREEYFSSLEKLLFYGAVDIQNPPRFYNQIVTFGSDNYRRGYWAMLGGNLDRDPQFDVFLRIVGGPHASIPATPYNSIIDGTELVLDDRIY